jgi:hypothetical protein
MTRHLLPVAFSVVVVFGIIGQASAEIWNVAALKPTTQSSEGWGGVPGNAVNGNFGDFTHTAADDFAPVWEVNLGEEFLIDSILLYNRESCCGGRLYNVTVEILDQADTSVYTSDVLNEWDGTTPTDPPDPGLGPFTFDFSGEPGGGIAGNKVRVTKAPAANDTSNYYLSLGELEVMADAPLPPVNVALGASVTATGPVYAGWDPNQITDGNLATQVHADAGATTYAYEIDLGQTIDFKNIDVWGRQDGCCPERLADYRISVHEDDNGSIGAEVWAAELVGQGSMVGAPDTFLVGDGVGTFSGQWIRIDRIDDTMEEDYVLQISEVQAFVIPEPTTLVLLAMGGLLLLPLWYRRRIVK